MPFRFLQNTELAFTSSLVTLFYMFIKRFISLSWNVFVTHKSFLLNLRNHRKLKLMFRRRYWNLRNHHNLKLMFRRRYWNLRNHHSLKLMFRKRYWNLRNYRNLKRRFRRSRLKLRAQSRHCRFKSENCLVVQSQWMLLRHQDTYRFQYFVIESEDQWVF